MPTADELKRGRNALKTVRSVSLGPIDTSGRSFDRTGRYAKKDEVFATGNTSDHAHEVLNTKKGPRDALFQSGHEFTDMMVSMRRGITQMKASLLENHGVHSDNPLYARTSMDEWARRTHNVLQGHDGAEGYVDQVTRSIYDNWRAPGKSLTPMEKRTKASATLTALSEVSDETPVTGVSVYDQATKLSPREALAKHGQVHKRREVDAYGNFAYRINPVESRGKAPSGKMSRLSLNMETDDAPQMVKRMANVVKTERELVRQSKIMGPENIGTRVDDGVVYLGQEPDVNNAKRIDKALSKGMGQPMFSSAPPGMESLSGISSYAEYMPNTSSSHGSNRGEMVKDVVKQKLGGSTQSTHSLMGSSLEKAGYHPAKPSRIMTDTQKHLKASLAARRRKMGYED